MLPSFEGVPRRAMLVHPSEAAAAPAATAFAALEDNATIDIVTLVELYPVQLPVIP